MLCLEQDALEHVLDFSLNQFHWVKGSFIHSVLLVHVVLVCSHRETARSSALLHGQTVIGSLDAFCRLLPAFKKVTGSTN